VVSIQLWTAGFQAVQQQTDVIGILLQNWKIVPAEIKNLKLESENMFQSAKTG
jgi:hypothetical protein